MAGKAEAGGERKRNGRADASLGGDGPWCESTCCCYFVANVSVDAVASLNCSLLWYAACLVWSQCPLLGLLSQQDFHKHLRQFYMAHTALPPGHDRALLWNSGFGPRANRLNPARCQLSKVLAMYSSRM